MTNQVRLVGLDFGTTTSSAVVALASLQRTATGRMELEGIQEQFRSEMEFTPLLDDDSVDLQRVDGLLDQWLGSGHARLPDIFGGGALLTGLTAQKKNAAGLVRLIRERLGDSLVATAGDPCLESWLAFMGNCAGLSKSRPDVPVLNLDIGGGTTNLALGKNGEVSRCGCLFVGARHIQVTPGTYRIVGLSSFAQCIFKKLGITRQVGDDLAPSERGAFLDCCIAVLEHVCGGNPTPKVQGLLPSLTQASFLMPPEVSAFAITFSGGVGELIYDHVRGKDWPGQTAYGDLGIDLARRILESPLLNRSTKDFQPQSGGRATVFGLLRYATEVSGSTLYLPITDILPLNDVPIFGCIDPSDSDERIRQALHLVQACPQGGCIQLRLGDAGAATVRALGRRLADLLEQIDFPNDTPLVLLIEENVGRVLGQYASRWGDSRHTLLSIDEVPFRSGQYVRIGSPRGQVVPVSIYGLTAEMLS